MVAYASEHIARAQGFVNKIENAILFPLMSLMVAGAVLVFLWGAYEFVMNAADEGGRATGRAHMMYGIIGLLVILSAYTILKIAAATFGISPN